MCIFIGQLVEAGGEPASYVCASIKLEDDFSFLFGDVMHKSSKEKQAWHVSWSQETPKTFEWKKSTFLPHQLFFLNPIRPWTLTLKIF